jgi:signal transduction histidine kinase
VQSPHPWSPNPRNPNSVDLANPSMDRDRQLVDDQMRVMLEDHRSLVLQLDRTEARQRALLADLIHDDPLQLIVAAMLRLENLRLQLSGPGGMVVDEITDMLETAVEQLRSLIVTLTPPELQHGLRAALQHLADGIFVGSSALVGIVGPAHVRLDPKAKETVYRIVREALVNVRKHAQATNVAVIIGESSDTVRITISDDGVGIGAVEASPGHLGLASMRARALAARADLHVESEPGRGTVVQLVVPMKRPDVSTSPERDALDSVETPDQP